MCMHNEQPYDTILSPALRCSDSDNVSSVDYIPPLLLATFKFNHRGSAVVQILWDPALPVITQTVIEFWKNLEVEPG